MHDHKSKSSLSLFERRLIELMQRLNFGRIEGLQIRAGQPVFSPAPRIIRKVKLGGENGPRPEFSAADFWLKAPVVELLETIASAPDGQIPVIDVRYGLPFSVELEHRADALEGGLHD